MQKQVGHACPNIPYLDRIAQRRQSKKKLEKSLLSFLIVFIALLSVFDAFLCDFEPCFGFWQAGRVDYCGDSCAFASFSKVNSMRAGMSHNVASCRLVGVSEKCCRIRLNLVCDDHGQVEGFG
jgi:hypothetical protein